MDNCIKCKKNAGDFEFEVLEVHNTRRRNSKGLAFKTQEICGKRFFSVCNLCIDAKLNEIMNPRKQIVSVLGIGFILCLFGIFLVFKFYSTDKVYTVFGAVCILAFIYKAVDFYKTSKSKKAQYQKYNTTNARFVAAWEVVSASVPRNMGDSKVFYLPITKATYEMKRDDFTKYYGLTRPNADEFYKILHGSYSPDTIRDRKQMPNTELSDND